MDARVRQLIGANGIKLHIALLTHAYGSTVLPEFTFDGARNALYERVLANWDRQIQSNVSKSDDPVEVVELYFQYTDEYAEIVEATLGGDEDKGDDESQPDVLTKMVMAAAQDL